MLRSSGSLGGEFVCFVLAPKGLESSRLIRAADRAGGIGFIQENDRELAAAILAAVSAGAVRVGVVAESSSTLKVLAGLDQQALTVVMAPGWVIERARSAVAALRRRGVQVLCIATRWDETVARLESRIDGYVLRGHECGGVVSEQTTFILVQEFRRQSKLPFYAQGGITPATAAAARVGGAAGVVLDDQIMLLAEVDLPEPGIRRRLESFSGSETLQVEHPEGDFYIRGLDRPGTQVAAAISLRLRNAFENGGADQCLNEMHQIAAQFSWRKDSEVMPAGQGLALAAPLARRFGTLGRLVAAIRAAVQDLPDAASRRAAFQEGSALAHRFGTRFPIVQGPMTRVSDVAEFSVRVGEAGALPMSALALLKKPEVETLLTRTREQMQGRPWGVGMLGFAPQEILAPQFEAVQKCPPDFAILAGGRASQVRSFEKLGIRTFVHASTAGQLGLYLDDGMRRFVMEGRECGGHIGPLTSFTLWGLMVETLLAHPVLEKQGTTLEIVFAGGIHDAVSAAMAATVGEPLAAKGVALGMLMGTAYLYTREIVESGAVLPQYQEVALGCDRTQSLWEGPGFASRCAVTPIAAEFRARKRQMESGGSSVGEVRKALEEISIGRLRAATKGLVRTEGQAELARIGPEERYASGMYMIGQAAVFHDELYSIADLHEDVTAGSASVLKTFAAPARPRAARQAPPPADIAIVGAAVLLPGSDTLGSYWRRILSGVSAIREIPEDRWDLDAYFDGDRTVRDRIYSRRGGFLNDVAFDPLAYGIPPSTLSSVDPMQLLSLELVSDVLKDARRGTCDQEDLSRVSVMLGFSGGIGEVGGQYLTRSELVRLFGREIPEEILAKLPEWTEDSFSGTLPNVSAGRAANRFNFGGTNVTVDAACASSLAALYQGVMELETGRSDMVIAGGIDTQQSPFGYLCFAKTGALSPRGICNTFDARADGIVISEGLAAVALKRLADAEAQGDRIYAVIKGVGASSDGRAKGLTAPLPKGQKRALWRAYDQAGYSPAQVDLFEAHGTGTVAGDRAELETVTSVLRESGASDRSVAIGSVKALIGHTKATAGVAGLIKTVMGLHQKVLPPHALVETPNPVFGEDDMPLTLSMAPRPWIVRAGQKRRAGVSAFGFGGTNFHVTVEEHRDGYATTPKADLGRSVAPVVVAAASRADLSSALGRLIDAIETGAVQTVTALAAMALGSCMPTGKVRAGFVATGVAESVPILAGLRAHLDKGAPLRPGVHFSEAPELLEGGKLAFLFPGQGSQYPGMLREAAILDPAMLGRLDAAEAVLSGLPSFRRRRLAQLLYPGDAFDKETRKAQMAAITETQIAQPALGAVEGGLIASLNALGVTADMVAGHSYGEFVALHAANCLGFDDLLRLSEARGRAIIENADESRHGAMAAVSADGAATAFALKGLSGVTVANFNSPTQTVIAGSVQDIAGAVKALAAAGLECTMVPVSQAFHSHLMVAARGDFDAALKNVEWSAPTIPVYSNTLGRRHADDPAEIRETMSAHLVSPVDFVAMARAMVADGARVFLEVGPKSVLSSRMAEILGPDGGKFIALDRTGVATQSYLDGLVGLFVVGAAVDFHALTARLAAPESRQAAPEAKQLWYLNGAYVRRSDQPRRTVKAPAEKVLATPTASGTATTTRNGGTAAWPIPNSAAAAPATGILAEEGLEFMEIKPERSWGERSVMPHPDVMGEFHHMMTEFLHVQENVMLAYLGREVAASARPALPAPMAIRVAPQMPMPAQGTPPVVVRPATEPAPMAPTFVADPADAAPKPAFVAPAPAVQPAAAAAPAPVAPIAAPVSETRSKPPAESEVLTAEGMIAKFVAMVSEKTGYPEDALDPDQGLEADLGVDSIKRMEILGALQKSLPQSLAERMRSEMDAISDLATIREIANYVVDMQGGGGGAKPQLALGEARPFDLAGEADDRKAAELPRFVQRAFAEPADHVAPDLPDGQRILVTESSDGFHVAVLAELQRRGLAGVLAPREVATAADPAGINAWLDPVRAEGPLAGLIFLESRDCANPATFGLKRFRAAHRRVSKALYRLVRALAPDLASGGRIVVASQMGGYFGRTLDDTPVRPGTVGGGAVGIVKALSLEWRGCSSKAVDLDVSRDAGSRAAHLVHELSFLAGRREVGYPAGVRTIFRTEPSSMAPPRIRRPMVDANWVVLATGGARGITAECLRTLAPYEPTLILVGRSRRPEPEPEDMMGLDEAGLRDHFLAAARAAGQRVTPREIAAQVRDHMVRRDMARNLADLAALGAKVDYRALDVCDEAAMQAMFADIYRTYGRLDMIVHGAGVIEDALVEKKSPESFDRVFDTKVDAAFLLSRFARSESLKSVCFFTSVAGRYGNAGQVDYACANETLNRFAWDLKRRWPGVTVKAINWGPWGQTTTGAGMVTPEVRAQFLARGIGMVEAVPGREFFFKEMFWAPDAEVESVAWVADGETMEATQCAIVPAPDTPRPIGAPAILLAQGIKRENGVREVVWRFDPVSAPYVDHHRFDGSGVMPLAGMMQMMSELPAIFGDTRPVVGLEDVAVLNGLTLGKGAQEITFETVTSAEDAGRYTVKVTSSHHPGRICYRGLVRVADDLPRAPSHPPFRPGNAPWDGPAIDRIYQQWLSHGPRFQTLDQILSCETSRITATLRNTAPQHFVPTDASAVWTFDPGVVDGLLQLVWIWSRRYQGASALPSAVGSCRRFAGSPATGPLLGEIAFASAVDDNNLLADFRLYDASGALLLEMSRVAGMSSQVLNRLSGGWQGGRAHLDAQVGASL